MVRNLPVMQETWVQSLGQEDAQEDETASIFSSILAWRVPWTQKPGRLTVHGVANSVTNTFTF